MEVGTGVQNEDNCNSVNNKINNNFLLKNTKTIKKLGLSYSIIFLEQH